MDPQAQPSPIKSSARSYTLASISTQGSASSTSSTSSNAHKCGTCGATFTRKNNKLRHEKDSCGQRNRYICINFVDCQKSYSRLDGLMAHIKEKHGNDEYLRTLNTRWYSKPVLQEY